MDKSFSVEYTSRRNRHGEICPALQRRQHETEAEQATVMQAWGAWYEGLGSAVVDPGNPLNPMVKNIASNGTVSDGPVGTMVSGYTILMADSLDAAVDMAKGCPVLQGGSQISVYEAHEMR